MVTKRVILYFPQKISGTPVVYQLAKEYDLEFNILKADVNPEKAGRLVLEVRGMKKNYEAGIQFLKETGIQVKPLSQKIQRDEDLCCDCGVCVTLCPTKTFVVDSSTRNVDFEEKKCVFCGLCVKICPYHAMSIQF